MLFSSCESGEKMKKEFNEYYSGKHELRKFSSQERTTASSMSASYFLFWGSASGKGEEKVTYIALSWKNNKGEYILSKIPMEKVRVKFDESVTTPYITLSIEYDYRQKADEDVTYVMEYRLNHIVVHCKSKEYPTDISINDLR